MENIWIAIIGFFFKDIIVAVNGLFKKRNPAKRKKLQQKKYDALEEHRDILLSHLMPILKISILRPNYLFYNSNLSLLIVHQRILT